MSDNDRIIKRIESRQREIEKLTGKTAGALHDALVLEYLENHQRLGLLYLERDKAERPEVYLTDAFSAPETGLNDDRRLLQWDIRKDRDAYPEGPLAKDKAVYKFTGWEGAHRGTLLLTEAEADFVRERLTTASPAPETNVRGSVVTLREAAQELLDAQKSGQRHVGYRLDLWSALEATLSPENQSNG